jgi:dTDP-4-amino-4,6-dideoxygalactose transaminase
MTVATQDIPLVDLKSQYATIRDEVRQAIDEVLDSMQLTIGPNVRAFDKEWADYCGTTHAIGVGSGTDALQLAIRACGVSAGDEVITVSHTFFATVEAIVYANARPILVDVEERSMLMDISSVASRITPRTKAIIPVHLYGQPADMDPILALARKYGLKVVGDGAQAHGAQYKGQPIAKLADITCFSFYPGKNLGAYGDAGALVTDNEEWAASARKFANHGRAQKYDHDFEGINSRLDGLQAAILSVKLPHLDRWTEGRRNNAYKYNEALEGLNIVTPREMNDVKAVYHLYVVRVPNGDRDKLRDFLKASGVEAGVHYPIALPYLNAYRYLNHSEADFPEALKASGQILSLPLFSELTDEQRSIVAHEVRSFSRRS